MTHPDKTSKVAPVYLVIDDALTIEAPIAEVWRHTMNYPTWQNFPIVEHISGAPGQERQVVRLQKEEEGFTFPPYYAFTIKIEPLCRVIWKVYLEPGAEPFEFFGIVEFRLQQAGPRRTAFSYHLLYEFQVPHRDETELEAFRKERDESFTQMFRAIFPKLKKLAEQSGRRDEL